MAEEVSLALLRDGYCYAADLTRNVTGSEPAVRDVRLFGRRALLVAGCEATKLFYDGSRMERHDAMPGFLSDELFGVGTIHGLDGEAHLHRKSLHLGVLTGEEVSRLVDLVDDEWTRKVPARDSRPLIESLAEGLGAAAIDWSGIPVESAQESAARAGDLAAIVDGFGSIGRRNLHGRMARRRCERWTQQAIAQARQRPSGARVLDRVAAATEIDGQLLPLEVAAVELLNLLRPVTAVAYFGTFLAAALQTRPDWCGLVGPAGDDRHRRSLVHEVRRHYPFVPMLAARTRADLNWYGHQLPAGHRILLHVVATNHDQRAWTDPWTLRPERFLDREPDPYGYSYIPQGGDAICRGHRCPGEPTVVLLLQRLARHLAEQPPEHVLQFDARRMPALAR